MINPAATRAAGASRDAVVRALRHHDLGVVAVPSSADGLREAVRDAAAQGARVVAVLGGDGTIGIAAAELAGTDVALLPLPGGSTNVFARGIGWPARTAEALARVPEALAGPGRTLVLGDVRADDLGRVACINVGVGMDAAAVHWVERHPRAKRGFRQVAFIAAAAGPGAVALRRSAPMRLRVGHQPPITIHGIVVAWGKPYVYLGPRPLTILPAADWDGRMQWVALTRPSVAAALAVIVRGVAGRSTPTPGSIGGHSALPLVMECDAPFTVQVDGEPVGPVHRLALGAGPRLRVVTPQASGGPADN
ncbi:MAG: diacylglycerol kinase family protein [Thermoleophilia bacterium]